MNSNKLEINIIIMILITDKLVIYIRSKPNHSFTQKSGPQAFS